MNLKKVLQGLRTGLAVADALNPGEEEGGSKTAAILAGVFSRRLSSYDGYLHSIDSLIFLGRDDLPSLSEREEVRFRSGQNKLRGYLYRADVARGLIVYVHGISGQADDHYAIPQAYFLSKGYDVFAIDLTASGRSGGHGITGLQQGAFDVTSAVEYVQSRGDLSSLPLFLFGHSWGGYSVSASLNLVHGVKAVAAVSGFVSPLKEMKGLPSSMIGFDVSSLGAEDLEEALKDRAGENYDLSAYSGIESSRGTKVYLAQGGKDAIIPPSAQIYEACKGLANVQRRFFPDRGHMEIFYSEESIVYAAEVRSRAKDLVKQYGKDIALFPPEVLEAFVSSFDKRMTSCLNEPLFDEIDRFYGESI